MELILLSVPAGLPHWRSEEVKHLRRQLATNTYEEGEALFWCSNKQPVPEMVFKDALVEMPAGQEAAHKESLMAFFAERRAAAERRANPKTESEVLFALAAVSDDLSPESLYCDGECSQAEADRKSKMLLAERARLEKILKTFRS